MKDDQITTKKFPPSWRFWVPLALQACLIVATPIQAIYTYTSGKTVILKTQPLNPYDLLRGYSQQFIYDISDLDKLKTLKGWDSLSQEGKLKSGDQIYVIVEAPQTNTKDNKMKPLPWNAVAVSRRLPTNLSNNQIALQGQYRDSRIEYGVESYYLPEEQRNKINGKIKQLEPKALNNDPFVVEVKVDSKGFAVPVSLWIGDENFDF